MPDPDAHSDPSNRSLAELAKSAALGDLAAFRALHERLDPGVRRFFARRVGLARHAQDELSQRTWVAFWDSLRQARYDATRSSVTTYIYAVAYKVWLQTFRRQPSRVAEAGCLDDFAASLFDPTGAPSDVLHAAEMIDAVRDCLNGSAGLTPQEGAVIHAVARGASERDIAAELRIAPSTVNARKRSALDKLRQCLAAKGFHHDTGEHTPPSRE